MWKKNGNCLIRSWWEEGGTPTSWTGNQGEGRGVWLGSLQPSSLFLDCSSVFQRVGSDGSAIYLMTRQFEQFWNPYCILFSYVLTVTAWRAQLLWDGPECPLSIYYHANNAAESRWFMEVPGGGAMIWKKAVMLTATLLLATLLYMLLPVYEEWIIECLVSNQPHVRDAFTDTNIL